jgi:hypothetical protein
LPIHKIRALIHRKHVDKIFKRRRIIIGVCNVHKEDIMGMLDLLAIVKLNEAFKAVGEVDESCAVAFHVKLAEMGVTVERSVHLYTLLATLEHIPPASIPRDTAMAMIAAIKSLPRETPHYVN